MTHSDDSLKDDVVQGEPQVADPLERALALQPLTTPVGSYVEFLKGLKDNQQFVRTAAAVILSALSACGVEDPAEETDPERRQYLEMLKEMNIPSLKAFKHAAGTQRFAAQILSFLKSAAANGQQLYQMLVIEGGAGSGKDFFLDGISRALQSSGEVFAIKGCEHHENPLNLLHLLSSEQRKVVAEASGLTAAELNDMLAVAGKPCQSCFNKVFGTLGDNPSDKPSLKAIEVEKIRLEPRSAGVANWQPGAEYSLAAALKMGNRGVLTLPDGFIERKPRAGETDERLLLLDVTQEKRVPAGETGAKQVSAPAPLDCVIIITTNANAYAKFLGTLPDQNAFTSRGTKLVLPYNTVLCEEVRAYQGTLARATDKAEFDPLVLKMLATVAVLSRFSVPASGEFIHPIDKMRRYNGEIYLDLKPVSSSRYAEIWGSGSKAGANVRTLEKDEPLTIDTLWKVAGEEGVTGLDMRYMLGIVSSINRLAAEALKRRAERRLKSKKAGKDKDEGKDRVLTLEVMDMLRTSMLVKQKDTSLTDQQRETYKRVVTWLGGEKPWGLEAPELIEREYRRLLKQQILATFAPDYETRAERLFQDYLIFAPAIYQEQLTVFDPRVGSEVQTSGGRNVVDVLDRIMAGKGAGATLDKQDRKLGGVSLQVALDEAREKYVAEHPDNANAYSAFKETWRTIPELAIAIASKLDGEVGKSVETILSTEIVTDLKPAEQELYAKAKAALEAAGYSPSVQKPVLEYAKRVRVWAHKDQ
jgi:predicted Ser/Thr protein kinase